VPGYDSQTVSEGRRGEDLLLTRASALYQSIKCSGQGCGREAASSGRPRAWRRLARGGVRPSNEAETRPRGRPARERGGDFVVRRLALERGGSSPEGR
jgi:hypothetical protein